MPKSAEIYLINAPTLYWARTLGLLGRTSYRELIVRSNDGIGNCRFYPFEYLGHLSIRAYCERKGLAVESLNGVGELHRSVEETFSALRDLVRRNAPPKLIGLTGTNLVYGENRELAALCKREWPDSKVVLGHDFASLNSERILRECPDLDFVLRGEGEVGFHALAEKVLNGSSDLSDVPALAWIDSGRFRSNAPTACDLDSLPEVSRVELPRLVAEGHCGSIFTTRGCPFRCTFCTTGQISALTPSRGGYRLRSIPGVIEEVKRLRRDYGLRTLNVVDDLFFAKSDVSKARAEEFARGLIDSKLDVQFMFDCRVDSIDLDLFRLLKEAGLREIFVGVETGSDEQRAKYNKRFASEIDPSALLNRVTELGIRVVPGIITYHPDVTLAELESTLSLVERLGPQRSSVFQNKMKPYPGTPLYREYLEKGLLKTEWPVPDYDFRDPRIERIFRSILDYTAEPGTTPPMIHRRMRELLRAENQSSALL
jgi:radical SAM superfamily enzyme YgiQ (UPF0313 family)